MKIKENQQRFTDEFKEQAVRQVTERGHKTSDVASRLGISTNSLYAWLKRYAVSSEERVQQDEHRAENRRLKVELGRVSEECDILKTSGVKSFVKIACNLKRYTGQWVSFHSGCGAKLQR